MRILLFGLSLAFFTTSIVAQSDSDNAAGAATTKPQPQLYASLRVQAYDDALGLTKEQLAELNEIFLQGEQRVVDLRMACLEAQRNIESTMKEHARKAESKLTKEQQAKLLELRKTGDFNAEVPSCMPVTMGGCKHSAACCAGAKSDGAKPKVERPQPTIHQQGVPEITSPK